MRKEMDKAGVKDPQVLDKSYWIQRVGEVWDQGDNIIYFHPHVLLLPLPTSCFPLLISQISLPPSSFPLPTSRFQRLFPAHLLLLTTSLADTCRQCPMV